MAFEHKDGTGSLFKNDDKQEATHADYKGTLVVAGTHYSINAWVKEGKNGKFFSLSVKPKQGVQKSNPPKDNMKPAQKDDFDDSDLPF